MSLVPVTIVVTDKTLPVALSVPNVIVRFYSTTGDTFITEGVTDSDGELTLDLEDLTEYWVRLFKVEWKFPSKLKINVDSSATTNTFDVKGTDLSERPSSLVPELCRVSGTIVGVHGAVIQGATLIFDGTDLPYVVAGRAILASKVSVRSDKFGYVEVDLIRGGSYDATVSGHEDKVIRVKIPDEESADIADILFPYSAQFYFEEGETLALTVDDTAVVSPRVVLSSGVVVPYTLDERKTRKVGELVNFQVSVDGIVQISAMSETMGSLTLIGKETGTTVISATVVEGVEATRLPAPIRNFKTLTVTVS